MANKYDFCGWATRANLKCSDGVIIMKDAFASDDGKRVPLVWMHNHLDPSAVIGHADLESRDGSIYAKCSFNDSPNGRLGKMMVQHGDVNALSIFANGLKKVGNNVTHGIIREVSLVLAGANPGACIVPAISHDGMESNEEAIIYHGADDLELVHSDDSENEVEVEEDEMDNEEIKHADGDNKKRTVEDVLNSMTEEQRNVTYALVGMAWTEGAEDDSDNDNNSTGGSKTVKHNAFDGTMGQQDMTGVIMHSDGTPVTVDEIAAIFSDIKRYGSLKDSCLQHGIEDVEYLFPDDRNITGTPTFIQRDQGWVTEVMNTVHHTPFSRIKSMFADITEDDARAKGYIKGKMKKEEFFSLMKRSTTPTTVYKKQKMDRNDVIDIVDFDVVNWLKTEMRMMLNEELARAYLLGDGRLASSDDKINEQNIRPIALDDDLFTIHVELTKDSGGDTSADAKAFIKQIIRSRKQYKGSGNPVLFTTEDMLTEMLLLTDEIGRDLYADEAALARKLRVRKVVTVPPMETAVGKSGNPLIGVLVNMTDYNVGADKGGAVSMFDDFDIDYNQQKYLIETRCSGALTVPYSAIAFELKNA